MQLKSRHPKNKAVEVSWLDISSRNYEHWKSFTDAQGSTIDGINWKGKPKGKSIETFTQS